MNIQVQKLRKSYKDREVLKNISFEKNNKINKKE